MRQLEWCCGDTSARLAEVHAGAISPTMIAATTQSTAMQNGGHHRVLATK
jgi:hypothetical protein